MCCGYEGIVFIICEGYYGNYGLYKSFKLVCVFILIL